MNKRNDDPAARRLLVHLAPDPKNVRIVGLLTTTYDLQPEFFDGEFLPTVLGIQTLDDRSWNARLKMERELAGTRAAIAVMAAARYRGRPRSLRVDLHAIAPRHVGVQHAKITLVEQERAIRLLVGSANLTEAGYRRNREVAAALEATQQAPDHAPIILGALRQMPARLHERIAGHENGRNWLASLMARLDEWTRGATVDPSLRFLWGGEGAALWEQFIGLWESTTRIQTVQMVSPFWSDEDGAGPVTQWVRKLRDRDLLAPEAEVRLLTSASLDGSHRPTLPPSYLSLALRDLGVRISACAVDPRVDEREVDIKGYSAMRNLHAKLLVFESASRALVYLGSANMSHQGWGFVGDPNIEAGIAIDLRGEERRELASLLPPITGTPVRLDGDVVTGAIAQPGPDTDEVPWPAFLEGLDLEPAGQGTEPWLHAHIVAADVRGPWTIATAEGRTLLRGNVGEPPPSPVPLDSETLRRLMGDEEACVRWWALAEDSAAVRVPINVTADARDLIPFSLEHRQPGEAALIAYYQARFEFSDLFPALPGEGGAEDDDPMAGDPEPSRVDTSRIQSYQIREFIEALPGLRQDIQGSTHSESAMRMSLRGPVSPLALGKAVLQAVGDGVRTPIAAAFQLVELRSQIAVVRRFDVTDRLVAAWHAVLDQTDTELAQMLTRLGERYPETVAANTALWRYAEGIRALHSGGST